jgi:large subunit ribosomal protein L31
VKPDIHPEYRPVVFRDAAAGVDHLIGSTIRTELTTTVDGVTYPLVMVEISSASHPFYTGKMRIVDTAGRVERFEQRYGRRKKPS